MNKKLLITVAVAVLLVAIVALSACKGASVLDAYDGVKEAKTVVQTITITSGSTEVAKQTSTYNMESGKATIEKKILNDVSANEQYSTTSETKSFTKCDAVAKLKGLTMSAVVESENSFKGTVANADLKTAFGIESSSVKGDATVELSAKDGKVTEMKVSYTSSNNNSVVILTTFAY